MWEHIYKMLEQHLQNVRTFTKYDENIYKILEAHLPSENILSMLENIRIMFENIFIVFVKQSHNVQMNLYFIWYRTLNMTSIQFNNDFFSPSMHM